MAPLKSSAVGATHLLRVLCGCVVWTFPCMAVLATPTPELDGAADGAQKSWTGNDDKAKSQGAEAAAMAAELSKVKAELAELAKVKSELELAKAELANVKSELELAKTEATQEHARKQLIEETVATQEKSVASLKAEVTAKEAQVQAKDAELKSKDAEMNRLNLEATTAITEKNTQSEALEAEQKTLATKLSTEKATVKTHAETIDHLRKELDAKTQEHTTLQTQEQDLRKEHTELAKKHAVLKSQYADPSVQHFLRAKAVKVYGHPAISGASNKTFTYVLPSLQAKYAKGKEFLNKSHSAVFSKLHAYVGSEKTDPWLPAISGVLVYGALIVPFFCTVCCLARVICRLRPILLFIHLDLLITTLCAGSFAVYTGKEPLAAFAHHDASVFLFAQAAFASVLCVYLTLLGLACCCASGYEKIYRCEQICAAAPIFVIYLHYVWTPAMMDEMPHMESVVEWIVGPGAAVSRFAWLPYLPISALFLLLLCLERLAWIASGKRGPEEMSVVMRNDIELATVIGAAAYSPVAQKEE